MTSRFISSAPASRPRTPSPAAMPDRCHQAATSRAAPAAGFAAAGNAAVTCWVTSVVLLAVRMLTWARERTLTCLPPEGEQDAPASATHADFVHTRKVTPLSFH